MKAPMPDEEKILSEITLGNGVAFTALYQYYLKSVYGYTLNFLKDEASAQEVVQDVFMKIWIRRSTLGSIGNFGGYLSVCTRNETLNAIKKDAVQQRHYQAIRANNTEIDKSTENIIHYRETRKMLDLAVNQLPPQQKRVYSLLNIQGHKLNEVAEQLHITQSTAKTHLKSAVKNIRNFLVVHYKTLGSILFVFHKIF